MSLTAEQIENACKAKPELKKISTPEWGNVGTKNGHVYVRATSALAVSVMMKVRELPLFEKDENAGAMIAWVVACVCDKEGVRLFDETACKWLADSNSDPVLRCSLAAQVINGSDKDSVGNSETSQTDGSP